MTDADPTVWAAIDGWAVCVNVNVYGNVALRLSPEEAEELAAGLARELDQRVPELERKVDDALKEVE